MTPTYAGHWNKLSSVGKTFNTSSADIGAGVNFQLMSSKLCCDKSTSARSPGDPPQSVCLLESGDPLQESVKELLFKGSRSDCEDKERTEDQLMPRSSDSDPLSEVSCDKDGSGVCLNAELKSFKGGSKPSLE